MKTFKDLKFKTHPNKGYGFSSQAKMEFENGYGISVITGRGAYGSKVAPYECAVLKGGGLCYDTPITDDVAGYCTKDDVSEIMIQIQKLPTLQPA